MALFGGTSKSSPSFTQRLYNFFAGDKREQQLEDLRNSLQERTKQLAQEDYEWWNELSMEDQQRAFRSVCRRIHQGDVVERGSYRHVLYDVFGFDADSYVDGMDSGYMNIHNLIQEAIAFRQGER
jgi:hypothetical protein